MLDIELWYEIIILKGEKNEGLFGEMAGMLKATSCLWISGFFVFTPPQTQKGGAS